VQVPELSLVRVVHMVIIVGEMSAAHMAHIAAGRKRYGHDTRLNLSLAGRLTAGDYVHAQRLRVRLARHFYELLEKVDCIVTPTTACAAPVIPPKAVKTGESNLGLLEQIMRYAPAANLTGCPAISFPAGYTEAGLPVGFQAMGRLWQEHTLLRLAAVAEGFVPRRAPKVHFGLLAD
jgi:Asp-tRNA(Asn)/Glu-tRNA(Gln) amidotransferase A subunit family amidase